MSLFFMSEFQSFPSKHIKLLIFVLGFIDFTENVKSQNATIIGADKPEFLVETNPSTPLPNNIEATGGRVG